MTHRKRWLAGAALAGVLGLGLVGAKVATAEPGALAGLIPPALADRPMAKALRAAVPKLRELRGELDLQPEQWVEIKGVLTSHDAEIKSVAKELRDKHRAVAAAIRAEPLDETGIRTAVGDMTVALADAAVLRAKVRREAATKLTAEQRETLDTFVGDLEQTVDDALDLGQ